MPSLFFDEAEIETHFDAKINKRSGLANVGRKHYGKRVVIIVIKGSNRVSPEVTDTPHFAAAKVRGITLI